MPLTDTACKNAKPAKKPYKKADGGGLYLEVMPNGSRYWRLKYRFGGKEKRLAFGVYPEISLAEARERREAARKLLAADTDPSLARQDRKQRIALNSANTEPPPINESRLRVINLTKWTGGKNGEKAVYDGADHWASAAR